MGSVSSLSRLQSAAAAAAAADVLRYDDPRVVAAGLTPVDSTDSRLTNARTPTAHAASHQAGGSDPLLYVIATKSAAYTLVDTDEIIIANSASAAFTLTLPTAVGRAGKRFLIKKLGGSTANPVTIASNGGTIDGATTEPISVAGGFRELVSDGTNWHIVGGKVEPVIVTATSPANGGTLTLDASVGNIYRCATSVAGFTLNPPTNSIDADAVNIEITPTVSFSLTVSSSILLTTGITTPIAVAANKKLFLGLRTVGTTWYLLAAQIQS